MTIIRRSFLDLKHLAALAQDLECGYSHRMNAPNGIQYVLDANVMWFFQDDEVENAKDYVAEAIGVDNAANLIRNSIQHLSLTTKKFIMLESHKYETEVAFASELPKDYDSLRRTVLLVFDNVTAENSKHSTPQELARKIVHNLKTKYRDEFRLITDILSKKPQRKHEIDKLTRTLPPPKYDRVPSDLLQTLNKVGFILREFDNRPNFSVSQDWKALRDVALSNASKHSVRTVLLTFDKKLLQAVRLVQHWNEPWADYLSLESCQTFWVWYLTDPKIVENSAAATLKQVMDDFRLKSRQLFWIDGQTNQSIWLQNKGALESLSRRHSRSENGENLSDERSLYKAEVIGQIKKTLEQANAFERTNSTEFVDMIQNKCNLFFEEVEQILPSFQLIVSDAFDREKTLETMLQKYGVEKKYFLTALDEEIQIHAKLSLEILGASSLIAPRTIQAIHAFTSSNETRRNYREFIHRVPLPIQSDEFNLAEVIALVSNDQTRLEARYGELIKIASWRGIVADLTVAYLFASSGAWDEAEKICRENLLRIDPVSKFDSVQYESHLLLAAILRIYQTSVEKLNEAEILLNAALESSAKRPSTDQSDIRIQSELVAIRLNRLLLDRYKAASYRLKVQTDAAGFKYASEILSDLLALKNEVAEMDALPTAMRDKINANINVNYSLVIEFILASTPKAGLIDEGIYGAILTEAYSRMSRHMSRISFFEEIIISYSILRNAALVGAPDFSEVEVAVGLRSKLGQILQRKERINEFEYWMYRYIHEKLNEFGFQY